MFERKKFIEDVAKVAEGDYSAGFKMLGFVLFVSECGPEPLLTGEMVSMRTYYRWVETIKAAGWGRLLADVRLKQALEEYSRSLLPDTAPALPEGTRADLASLLQRVMLSEGPAARSLPPQSAERDGAAAVKGEAARLAAEGAERRTLDAWGRARLRRVLATVRGPCLVTMRNEVWDPRSMIPTPIDRELDWCVYDVRCSV